MQQYELLCVLPGTLAEADVPKIMKTVQEAVESEGAAQMTVKNMGKSRLAYPMRHIRYGYFQLGYFSAGKEVIPNIQRKLNLMSSDLLRSLIRAVDEKQAAAGSARESLIAVIDPTDRTKRATPRKEDRPSSVEEADAFRKKEEEKSEDAPPAGEAPKKREAESASNLADIDKKLDEILNADLTLEV